MMRHKILNEAKNYAVMCIACASFALAAAFFFNNTSIVAGGFSGVAILLNGAGHGFVFTGCQVFFGKIIIKDSAGIVFNALNFGRKTSIDITGGGLVTFANSAFRERTDTPITVTQNDAVRFAHCYTRTGEPVTP